MRFPGATTFFLALLNVALGVSVVVLWRAGQARITEPERLSAAPLELPDLAVLNSVPIASVDVTSIREQAIFHTTRAFYRPPAAPVEIPSPAYELSGGLRLTDGKRIAFVRKKADQISRTLHVGDELEGWQVKAIDPDQVVLLRGEQSAVLRSASIGGVLGLIRGGGSTPRAAQIGIRILGNAQDVSADGFAGSPGGGRGATGLHPTTQNLAREARLFRPPPSAGK